MATAILLSTLLLSCGGGQDESETTKGTTGNQAIALAVEGCDEVLTVGPGTEIVPDTPPTPEPPDFVTKRVWLTTPWGTEVYKFGLGENFNTKAQSRNDGDGPCNPTDLVQTITGHFYLSRGYKDSPYAF